jgi:hypothetical protein
VIIGLLIDSRAVSKLGSHAQGASVATPGSRSIAHALCGAGCDGVDPHPVPAASWAASQDLNASPAGVFYQQQRGSGAEQTSLTARWRNYGISEISVSVRPDSVAGNRRSQLSNGVHSSRGECTLSCDISVS